MKIAFIGSHGVGKTTLCYELAARLKRQDRVVDLVMEVARSCPLPINRDTTMGAQAWILHTQMAQEIAAEARGGVWCATAPCSTTTPTSCTRVDDGRPTMRSWRTGYAATGRS